ncbi:elongation factor Ts, mitochondrial-like [Dendronephthya gigantea]|uniref:elongation factor Ts, mitochondrial-like n=1 Tax=Dendronephthya gigantea TaxID=151771 RepID=UPI00106CEB63|nr:elongation factor Ts, mitochondrial-like [Dendronephthya gigantea]
MTFPSLMSSRIWSTGIRKPIINLCQRRLSVKVDAKQLGNLRKQTGYGLSLCREALLGNNNDINAAQAWLDEQAIKKGWQKAEKLQEKKASDGLIGVMVEDNHAAMVEICCETDFVVQNDFFKDLVANITATALSHRKMIVQRGVNLGGTFTHFREVLLTHKLNELKLSNTEKTVNNSVLQAVGRLGERIMVKRALTITTERDSVIGRYVHGPFTSNIDGCQMGKFAAIIALKSTTTNSEYEKLVTLATSLSQHIVGMNPRCISNNDMAKGDSIHEDEILEEQNFLMDETIVVKELLSRNSVSVVDFVRMECGNVR